MKPEIIVVSGGIGSGKSTVTQKIAEYIKDKSNHPVEIFSFDEFTKDLYKQPAVAEFLTVMFGTTDKSKISDMVFRNPAILESLNEFFFKFVEEKFISLVNKKRYNNLIVEFPMYFEVTQESNEISLIRHKYKVITVTCENSARIARVQHRDGFSIEKIEAIFKYQLDQELKIERGDYSIDTTDTATVDAQIEVLLKTKFKKMFLEETTC